MIIKIDVDDGIAEESTLFMVNQLLSVYKNYGWRAFDLNGYKAKITHKSRAGNIFIHVSKTEGEALK